MSLRSSRISRWRLLAFAASALLLIPSALFLHASAASSFATPAFRQQWVAGEALVPNFWGPLELAHDGQREPYLEAPGGQRLVQYFDKARMELTNPSTGVVTNGLLAVELINGRLQLGDNSFEPRPPAAVPMAGDSNNAGPTYAMLRGVQAQILATVPATPGATTTRALSSGGVVAIFPRGATFPQATIGTYDQTTGHNIPAAFAAFRDRAGLLTIGLAISEPFWSNVRVAGQPRDVLMQAFERRVLTYTPSNPAPFQVEFGNIGAHYFAWRYGGTSPTTPLPDGAASPPSTMPPPAVPAATIPAATIPPPARPPCPDPTSAIFIDAPTTVHAGVPTTVHVQALDRDGHLCGDGTPLAFQVQGIQTMITGGSLRTIVGGSPQEECSLLVTMVRNGVAGMTFTPAGQGTVDIRVYTANTIPIPEVPEVGCLDGGGIAPSYTPAIV